MRQSRSRAIAFGVAVHLGRFAVIMLALAVSPFLGVSGWYLGLFANVVCLIYAVVLVSVRRLWRTSGILVGWRGPRAAIILGLLLVEVLIWSLPGGLVELPPGFGLWALTLLLVGINEELTSRVVVLERLRSAFGPFATVGLTAALFGLQHLSAFATTDRDAVDIAGNILVSGCYGFALAAFQYRFRWVTPLILLHAAADFTAILAPVPLPDLAITATVVGFLALGFLALGRRRRALSRAD